MTITYRELTKDEIWLACNINIAEKGELVYRFRNGQLAAETHEWQRYNWPVYHWQDNLRDWRNNVGIDYLYGAFADGRIAGMASLRYPGKDKVALLVSIHVSLGQRRHGIGMTLFRQIVDVAEEAGAKAIGVYAVPTDSAIGFYLSQGFQAESAYVDEDYVDKGHVDKGHEDGMADIYMVRPLK